MDDARTVAHVRIAVDGRAVDVYATHLHYTIEGDGTRSRQLQDVLAHIGDTGGGAPHILLRDFNAPVASAALQPLLADYTDSYGSRHAEPDARANTTMNPEFFDRAARIDHIFVERGRFGVLDADIVLDQPDPDDHWPSDHFGMHAVLQLRPAVADDANQ